MNLRLCITALLLSLTLVAYGDEDLKVSDAWVRAGPPGVAVLAGYLTLSNSGTNEAVIDKVTSPDFMAVEIHRTVVKEGMARMLHQDKLTVPAGGKTVLAPGGLHLMLMHSNRALQPGQEVQLILHPANSGPVIIKATVKNQP